MNKSKLSIHGRIEVGFDSLYLLGVLGLGIYFVAAAAGLGRLWGVMALVLGLGDSFHLLPRVLATLQDNKARYRVPLGRGKQITSVTMTVFYLLLWQIGLGLFGGGVFARYSPLVYGLAAVRVLLCLLPHNRWTAAQPDPRWGVWRNLPFLAQGLLTAALWWQYRAAVPALGLVWLAVLLSFGFYLPVVLWSHKKPAVGMLMLPKTCMYLWLVAMGLGAF